MALESLTDRDKAILAFEAKYFAHTGRKEEHIRTTFKLSAARYYQLVNRVIDNPAALVHDPQLVKRLLNAREARIRARANREYRTVR